LGRRAFHTVAFAPVLSTVVGFSDGRESVYFYFDDNASRRAVTGALHAVHTASIAAHATNSPRPPQTTESSRTKASRIKDPMTVKTPKGETIKHKKALRTISDISQSGI
jgi:hypothetical protein